MGDDYNLIDEQPRHEVYLNEFLVDEKEISIKIWDSVRSWALLNGYDFSEGQNFPLMGYTLNQDSSVDYPMNMVNWFDCVKWCNARSEFMGRKPVYYSSSDLTDVYRSGESHLNLNQIDNTASGYRLPTEAEWEKAARGSVRSFTQDYPWGFGLNGSLANYKLSGDPYDDGTTPLGYYNSSQVTVSASLSYNGENVQAIDTANQLGLYDIIGNVSEWCWDWFDETGYNRSKYSLSFDPTGPDLSEDQTGMDSDEKTNWKKKVHRGGSYKSDPSDLYDILGDDLRLASRGVEFVDSNRKTIGLRTTRRKLDDNLWFDKQNLSQVNWYYLEWFGHFYQSELIWVYHTDHGWIYPSGYGSYDNWIYFYHKKGWAWTSKFSYPWFFNPENSKWYKDLSLEGEAGWFESKDGELKEQWGFNQ